jgi:hypothetical protein
MSGSIMPALAALMLGKASFKIGRDAGVKRTVSAFEDINVICGGFGLQNLMACPSQKTKAIAMI